MKNQQDHDVFSQQLKTLWTIESILVGYIPLLIERADNLDLKKSLALHFAETTRHKVAIEAICKQLNIYAKQGGAEAELKTILDNGEKKITAEQEATSIDAAIISGAAEIEQYEIAIYEQAAGLADKLGYKWIANRLYLTREEEKQSYTKLKFLEAQLVDHRAEIGQH